MFLKLPAIRAHHFTQVLMIIVILIIFEGVYLSFKHGGYLPHLFKSEICPKPSCLEGRLPYFAKFEKSDDVYKSVLCIDGTLMLFSSAHDVIHLVLVNPLKISSYTIETFLFRRSESMTDFVVPQNMFFVMITGEFTNKSLLNDILMTKFKYNLRMTANMIAMSGFVINSTTSHVEKISSSNQASIGGCVKMREGLTTCEDILCPPNKASFHVIAGSNQAQTSASICYNNTFLIGAGIKGGRGVNVLLINEGTLGLIDVRNFDTFINGDEFDSYLQSITGNKIVIIASEDEASKNLKNSTKQLLEEYFGSAVISKIEFRDHFVFVGQRGLSRGSAVEKLRKHYVKNHVGVKGCIGLKGIGIIRELSNTLPVPPPQPRIIQIINNTCIVTGVCPKDHVAITIDTGFKNEKISRACVDGKMIASHRLGRGMNMMVYNTKNKEIAEMKVFDTYEYDNQSISKFLKKLKREDLVIAFTYDDAARSLSDQSRKSLKNIGSIHFNNMHMRNAWILIGQMGIEGYSPFEMINFAQYNSFNWSEPIDFHGCVPFKIEGYYKAGLKDVNYDRIDYCNLHESNHSNKYFCSNLNRWQSFHTPLLQNPEVKRNSVFSLPIFVFACSDEFVTQLQLSRIKAMIGLKAENVMVLYDPSVKNYSRLIDLFGFTKVIHNENNEGIYKIIAHYLKIFNLYPLDVIIFEKGVFPTNHYLEYLSHLYEVYSIDSSLCCVSGYNHHAYLGTTKTSKSTLAFRTSDKPIHSYMMKISHIKISAARSIIFRNINLYNTLKESLIPEISYVVRHPLTPGHIGTSPLVRSYARGSLKISVDPTALHSDNYDAILIKFIKNSYIVKPLIDNDGSCTKSMHMGRDIVSIFHQNHANDYKELSEITSCLKMSTRYDNHTINGLYKGVFRFTYKTGVQIFLIGSQSSIARSLE